MKTAIFHPCRDSKQPKWASHWDMLTTKNSSNWSVEETWLIQNTTATLDNTWGLKDFLGGDWFYHSMGFSIDKAKWVPPFGKLFLSAKAEKVWGEVPYPLLLMPNANNSYTLQRGSFNLVTPLEFINDQQLTWLIDYHMGGWIFNRMPIIKRFKLREIFGLHGLMGSLSDRNNPQTNHNVLLLPSTTQLMGKTPYLEFNVGIDNIFKFFRVDYVQRLNL